MTGIQLCVILFPQLLLDTEFSINLNLDLFEKVLVEGRRFEELQAIKIMFIKRVQKGLLTPELMRAFLGNSLGQHAIVSQKAIHLFCEGRTIKLNTIEGAF
jgi:hypothetical protein